MLENIGSAMLILGSIWLHYVYGLDTPIVIFLCAWGIGLWLTTDRKYWKLQKELLEAKIKLTNAKARQYGAN